MKGTFEGFLIGGLETIKINLNGEMVLKGITLTINDIAAVLWQVYMVLNYIQMAYNENCVILVL